MDIEDVLKIINDDIKMLKSLMYQVKANGSEFTDPSLIQVSQLLDVKLNQRNDLMSFCANELD
ncbi:Spo0E like sporulation regulatory protein [Virgibacillus subterraneus]|uniref:Spo0E like sporulation regulatory protein n=2 Tax=Virgibacillus TaxID=84406 RepID=A0A1H0XUF4_9BACI|nr:MULTISPECIES: Spo0E family sporulation regulatory protein-aspartic acid phosphatase [Virgibacillus]SDQ06522.1 Spo0E like sporulation regulatory protein [Virgibacillus salinus]SEP61319.1 Spo0E like sporulation regulatory protein [Virgibacillus subterraneus]